MDAVAASGSRPRKPLPSRTEKLVPRMMQYEPLSPIFMRICRRRNASPFSASSNSSGSASMTSRTPLLVAFGPTMSACGVGWAEGQTGESRRQHGMDLNSDLDRLFATTDSTQCGRVAKNVWVEGERRARSETIVSILKGPTLSSMQCPGSVDSSFAYCARRRG